MSTIERVVTDVTYGFGPVAAVLDLAITDGLVAFTTDTNQIYVDQEGKRYCYDSIIMVDTEWNLMNQTTYAEGKLYFAEDTKCLYMNNNGVWEVVFETTEGIISSLPTYLSIVTSEFLPTTGDSKNIYLIPATDYDNVPYEFYLWNETSQTFFRIVPTKEEIINVIDEQLQLLENDLEARYIVVKAALAGAVSEGDIAAELAELLENYPLASTVYTKTETDALITATEQDMADGLSNAQSEYTKNKYTSGVFADVSGEITLDNTISLYKAPSTAIISFNINNIPAYTNRCISFDLIITGCTTVNPVLNENIKWLENVAPNYAEFDNVYLTFKTYDEGVTWLGFYQGGWN